MQKILITGMSGFVGSHLADFCLNIPNIQVYGIIMPNCSGEELKRIDHIKDKIKIFECNLIDKTAVENILKEANPDKIFHLAGQSMVSKSWQDPEDTLINNIITELNIFESLRKLKLNPIMQIAGSSEEYGLVQENELPVKEDNPLRPLSPYGVSKVSQDVLACQYYHSYGLKTIITRAFNHEGPRRGEQFVISNFAKQIAEIESPPAGGKKDPIIYVGNLEAKRDYSDVRDIVRAYWLATEKCKFGEPYNICSGKLFSVKFALNILLSFSEIKNIKIRQDPDRMRPSDIPSIFGDCSKFKKQTNWEPEINFEKTLQDTLDYWRELV
jgi:GDP-4-dehydro-6-deoxy-D-mannose reductase